MPEPQHTPGPWHDEHDYSGLIHIRAATNQYIATVAKPTQASVPEQSANARLIAAAPDLLAAAQAALRDLCAPQHEQSYTTVPALRAAIANAEGTHA